MAELGPVTCAGCGLLCDDVTVEAAGDRVRLSPECRLGADWFSERLRSDDGAPATISGEAVDVDTALSRAAELLRAARRPLVHGFDDATVEDARAAVALADRLGALVTTGPVARRWPGAPAVPLRGVSTATLGEIRDRSRVVVIWREDPEVSHPRLLDRLGFGGARPEGGDRSLVVVDHLDTYTVQRADLHLSWPRELDLEALTRLHVMQRGLPVPPDELTAQLSGLIDRLREVSTRRSCTGRAWPPPPAASGARSRCMSWCGHCATSATWSRSNCRWHRGRRRGRRAGLANGVRRGG